MSHHAHPSTASPPSVAATLEFIVAQAKRHVAARRVWLFGSRGRRTAHRLSDIDVCIERGAGVVGWGTLAAAVDEDAPTLLNVDLVDFDACGPALRDAVLREGVLIYERTADV